MHAEAAPMACMLDFWEHLWKQAVIFYFFFLLADCQNVIISFAPQEDACQQGTIVLDCIVLAHFYAGGMSELFCTINNGPHVKCNLKQIDLREIEALHMVDL